MTPPFCGIVEKQYDYNADQLNKKVIPEPQAHTVALISSSLALSLTPAATAGPCIWIA